MARIYEAALEGIQKFTLRGNILQYNPKLRLIKYIHYRVDGSGNGIFYQ
jgi:hypothetical protein